MRPLLARIKLAVFDVDGVLTDGRVHLDEANEAKEFHTQDGFGLRSLQRVGVEVAILTARESAAVARRAAELGIERLHQGARPKLPVLQKMAEELGLSREQVFYMGDDLPDAECLEWAGVSCAPSNARPEIKSRALVLTLAAGGEGAVREAAELIVAAKKRPRG